MSEFNSQYPKPRVEIGAASAVTHSRRRSDAPVAVRPPLPGSVILVHGVNDVGVAYGEVERGLCTGLGERLGWAGQYRPANYRMPTNDDKGRVEVDPDAVFFKRKVGAETYSPVIPFYWGYREKKGQYRREDQTPHGQVVDRHGNRLDKDASKGGGPFSNATTTLPDMWNRGFGAVPFHVIDRVAADPLRPILDAPGRMYMVLAAERLAALVSMIRDYEPRETVSIVCHSQGCLIALLAQALLLGKGVRPADTLVLTHPPYSLVDDMPVLSKLGALFSGGIDERMKPHYGAIDGVQTLDARLRTLAAIVHGVAENKGSAPEFHSLKDANNCGVVAASWSADSPERDNRGKVYLYFCPEDMTVALDNMQGIGWQGVPDFARGYKLTPGVSHYGVGTASPMLQPMKVERQPLAELGAGFFQRVFTARLRRGADGQGEFKPVVVGAKAPSDFALRRTGEDDHAHVASTSTTLRARLSGVRTITGEALKAPFEADMSAGALPLEGNRLDPKHETVDPIDAAISVTSEYGLEDIWHLLKDSSPALHTPIRDWFPSPNPAAYPELVMAAKDLKAGVEARLNTGASQASQRREIHAVYRCLRTGGRGLVLSGQLLVHQRESADDARLRQQERGQSDRSFHSAIFASAENHRRATAYDVAIGQGHAPSDATFHAYLCAVADWRLKRPRGNTRNRVGIMLWDEFLANFEQYWTTENDLLKQLIEGNCDYYTTGKLPDCLPILHGGLPPAVVSETLSGHRAAPQTQKASAAKPAAK